MVDKLKPSLRDIRAIRIPADTPDDKALLLKESYDKAFRKAELKKKELELESAGVNIVQRVKYAKHIFKLTVIWLLLVVVLLGFQGLHAFSFCLSDGVLIALISSTTVNVIGLLVIVIRYLFRSGDFR